MSYDQVSRGCLGQQAASIATVPVAVNVAAPQCASLSARKPTSTQLAIALHRKLPASPRPRDVHERTFNERFQR